MTNRQRYDPLNDYLFYKIMGEKGDEVQLLGFINAVLGKTGDDRFSSVEIIENKYLSPKAVGDKASILDVRAVLQGKTKVNIEVQIRNQNNMDRRSLFYWSREYSESLEAGQDYRELPDVIAINIVNFDYPPARNCHTRFRLREDLDRELTLTDALEIHFINMVQYRKQGKGRIQDNPLGRWLAWLDVSNPPELVAEVAKMDSAIQAADERMVYVTGDKEAIRAYEMRQMALSDYTSSMNYARETGHQEGLEQGHQEGLERGHQEGIEQGRQEGRQEGRADEKLEIARKMKNAGRPLSEITEFTGLPTETIEQL